MTRGLLDVNVLVALIDTDHELWADSISLLDPAHIDGENFPVIST